MRRLSIFVVAGLLACLGGCRSPRSDLVEAELRTRNRELRELQCELVRAETMNEALENTLRSQQRCPQPGQSRCVTPSIRDIQLARGTGGVDEDNCRGDEGLLVVVVPRDIDGSPVKVAGTLKIGALEITPEGLKIPLSTWEITALQLRRSWKTGLLSSGYHVPLAWQKIPSFEKLRIVATFLPLEGGVYEAEKDVSISLIHTVRPPAPPAGLAPPTPSGETPILAPPVPASEAPILAPPEPILQPPTSAQYQPAAKLMPPRTG